MLVFEALESEGSDDEGVFREYAMGELDKWIRATLQQTKTHCIQRS